MLPSAVDDYLRPGRVVSGRFRLERQLGYGGMGTVWEARHLSLETQIAIKFLNPDLTRRQDVLARFAREATSAARISSPHVVSILDSGFTDDGRGFIAMELLRGEDLGRRLARFGKLTLGETWLLVTQVARGLAKAHSVGVIHRDLKPENIFVVDEDDAFSIKILDFGIAKSVGTEAATHKTDTGQLLGTPLYMSPEQALGRPIDNRSDLYSLAVVAYRCLAGRPPFMYPAVGELIVAVSTHAPPPPSQFNPSLAAPLDEWFARALEKDPNARICQSATEVAESFKRACGSSLEHHHPSSGRLRVAIARQSAPPPPSGDTEELPVPSAEEVATTISAPLFMADSAPSFSAADSPSPPPPSRRRGWLSLGLVGAFVLVGGAIVAFVPHPGSSAVEPSSAVTPKAPVGGVNTPIPGEETTEVRDVTPQPQRPVLQEAPNAPAPGNTAVKITAVLPRASSGTAQTAASSKASEDANKEPKPADSTVLVTIASSSPASQAPAASAAPPALPASSASATVVIKPLPPIYRDP